MVINGIHCKRIYLFFNGNHIYLSHGHVENAPNTTTFWRGCIFLHSAWRRTPIEMIHTVPKWASCSKDWDSCTALEDLSLSIAPSRYWRRILFSRCQPLPYNACTYPVSWFKGEQTSLKPFLVVPPQALPQSPLIHKAPEHKESSRIRCIEHPCRKYHFE